MLEDNGQVMPEQIDYLSNPPLKAVGFSTLKHLVQDKTLSCFRARLKIPQENQLHWLH
jgi:hypothetical protein